MSKLIEIKNLNKYFGNVKVLDDINIDIKKGEILGLAGANGSGKSTLLNILFGNEVITSSGGYKGKISFEGKEVNIENSSISTVLGMGMIHQEFSLIEDMSVYENIKLFRENTYRNKLSLPEEICLINRKKDKEDAEKALKKLGIELDANYDVRNLSTSLKQFIEIAREIDKSDLKVLFLDEPTAVLSDDDSEILLKIIKNLSKDGISIVFVTHRLHEMEKVCDRVVVLRDGKLISTLEKEDINSKRISYDMIGSEVSFVKSKNKTSSNKKVLEVKNLYIDMPGELIKDISFDVFEGEILGVTSLSGHGKLAIGYGLMGMFETRGNIEFKENKYFVNEPSKNIKNGVIFLSDERKTHGLLLNHSITDNIVFTANQTKKMFSKKIFNIETSFIDKVKCKEHAERYINLFNIKCESEKQLVKELSGGNQQKICLARAISTKPELLVVSEPTRGIDIAAKEKILENLIDINKKDKVSILMASSELDDLRRICDRIMVLCEGKISAILSPDSKDLDFALALSGERSESNDN